jgi:hypothetical protein
MHTSTIDTILGSAQSHADNPASDNQTASATMVIFLLIGIFGCGGYLIYLQVYAPRRARDLNLNHIKGLVAATDDEGEIDLWTGGEEGKRGGLSSPSSALNPLQAFQKLRTQLRPTQGNYAKVGGEEGEEGEDEGSGDREAGKGGGSHFVIDDDDDDDKARLRL